MCCVEFGLQESQSSIQLGVICKAIELNVKFTEDMAKGEEGSDEEKQSQDRALGPTCSDWRGIGFRSVQLDELSVACKIGMKAVGGGCW